MANCPSYCAGSDFPEYPTGIGCNTKFTGGVPQAVLIGCNNSVDPDSPTLGADINALITGGNAALLSNLKINVDAPSAVTGPSFVGCVPDTFITSDHTITFIDRNVTEGTVDYYNDILSNFGGEIGGMILYECGADRITYYDMALSMSGGRVIPEQDNDLQRFEWTFTGRSPLLPVIRDTPAGVFA